MKIVVTCCSCCGKIIVNNYNHYYDPDSYVTYVRHVYTSDGYYDEEEELCEECAKEKGLF